MIVLMYGALYGATGWLKCIGCLKLQVSFRKRATNYCVFLRKMTCKDAASYGSSPPCTAGAAAEQLQFVTLFWLYAEECI